MVGATGELSGVGPWRLVEVLGSGERATVYRALREGAPASAPPMAVKVLHAALSADPIEAGAFVSRARVGLDLARLDHPAIVTVHEVVPGARPYVVMDLVDGLSVERLRPDRGRPKMALEAATNVMIAALDALSGAANVKRLHGRLGPSDVIVRADGTVVVTSFGQDGDARADFLGVHALAQGLGAPWLPEVDAWLDRLAAEDTGWRDIRQARQAFPLAFTDAGQATLERAVKNRRKKDQKAAEAAAAEARGEPPPGADKPAARGGKPKKERRPRQRLSSTEAEGAVRQARAVAFVALSLVALALVLELTGLGG